MGKQQIQGLPPEVDVDLLNSIFANMDPVRDRDKITASRRGAVDSLRQQGLDEPQIWGVLEGESRDNGGGWTREELAQHMTKQGSGRMIDAGPEPSGYRSQDGGFDFSAAADEIAANLFGQLKQPPGAGRKAPPASILSKMGPDLTPAYKIKLDQIARQKERLGGRREYIADIFAGMSGGQSDDPVESFASSFQRARKNRMLREDTLGKLDAEEADTRFEMESDRLARAYWGDMADQMGSSGDTEFAMNLLDRMIRLENARSMYPGRDASADLTRKKVDVFDEEQTRKSNESASRIENTESTIENRDRRLGMEEEMFPLKKEGAQSLIDSRKAGARSTIRSQKMRALSDKMSAAKKGIDAAIKAKEDAVGDRAVKKAGADIGAARKALDGAMAEMEDLMADLEIDDLGLSDDDRADLDATAQRMVDDGNAASLSEAKRKLLERAK